MDNDAVPPPIAIIGSGCRFPGGASNPSKLWKLLKEPRDLLKEIPRDRFHWEGVYRPDGLHGTIKTKEGYFLEENIRSFDPQFFNISPADAENIDPQQRLLLETVYEAIESAGLCLEDLQGTDAAVFVGQMANEYYEKANSDVDACPGQILTTGTARSIMANRISYVFDLRGPSVCVDTACSSSMMAVHLAVSSLRRGEARTAFACGAHLNLTSNAFKALHRMNMIGPDGRSKMFDEAANGYGRGEGTAVVCLKRLDAALEDGDPIECIIRETGTNQDGRTKGITMPSAEAQAALIRKTYRSAGLDPTHAHSRPSFFEAHGTGTLVGDPLEAQAVQAAFFPPGRDYTENEVLYIGSIKTVIGHTEGAAGIAGLLRAALAVRHGVIPPNLLFSRMSPKVQPHTKNLHLATVPHPWPVLPRGCPRRASINSFGFGGSNVHVIIESYTRPPASRVASMSTLMSIDAPLFTPFVFSGISERALTANMETYVNHLMSHKDQIRVQDLAWTLQYKRSQFAFRHTVAACGVDELVKKLQSTVRDSHANHHSGVYTRTSLSSTSAQPRIMGIFSGQGAQWATMGKDLIDRSPFVRAIVAKLDAALGTLPVADRPQWNLKEELMVESRRSRINEASLAQPLTTAIQIILVDLIEIAGLQLHTVVGHSSGEIAAAYASGLITADDAIRIAYYRGMHCKHAHGANDRKGAMLAASLTREHADDLCCLPQFRDRMVVAAINSPSLVTLAGDTDAINEAIIKLEADQVFVRKLQVDKAYHSHHMKPCVAPYVQSLEKIDVTFSEPSSASPIWFSSSFPGRRMTSPTEIKAWYWIENLIRPVEFSAAISAAINECGLPDLFLEIGPHPALEKPVRQTVGDVAPSSIAYTSFLRRGTSAIASVSEALGLIWRTFGRATVNLANFDKVLSSESQPQPLQLKGLPTYPWQHDKEYWWENRFLRKRDQASTPPIDLLGQEWEIGASHEAKWRSFLDPREVPWLMNHKLNGVAVLPGAAYVSMAATAATRIFRNHTVQMIEIENLRFELPIVLPDEDTKIETVFSVARITRFTNHAEADFHVDFCSHPRNDEMMTAARGKVIVRFGFDADRTHPESVPQPSDLATVDRNLFYQTLFEAGYEYTGPFRCIQALKRRMDVASGQILATKSDLLLHPGIIDGLFQASFAAESFPGDSVMSNFRVPSSIRSIKLFPTRCTEVAASNSNGACYDVKRTAALEDKPETQHMSNMSTAIPSPSSTPAPPSILNFDVVRTAFSEYAGVLQDPSGRGTLCQMEGLTTAPFRISTHEDDLMMFKELVWKPCLPYHILKAGSSQPVSERDKEISLACERVSLYYLRQLTENITLEEEQCAPPALRCLLEFARLTLVETFVGLRTYLRKEWLEDNKAIIAKIVQQYPDSIDLRCVELMGKAYPSIITGEKSAISILYEGEQLTRLYRESLGFPDMNRLLAVFVEALTVCSPRVRILEVGAGTGSATEAILPLASYASYVFTDVSSAFLRPAEAKFKKYGDRISFQTFDIDKEPNEQGYESQCFEIIIASNVLHASADVKSVLRRLRSLLRPGGFLVCMELAAKIDLRSTVMFGALSGWWLGHGEDRFWSPALAKEQWHSYLKQTGFTGLDAITPLSDEPACPYRIFCSRAIDERTMSLRKPLTFRLPKRDDSLLILGSETTGESGLIQEIKTLLSPSFRQVTTLESLDDLCRTTTVPYAVLSLLELRGPIFRTMNPSRWSALQRVLLEATDIFWVTHGATAPTNITHSYMNMMPGLARALRVELPHLRLTFLDVDHPTSLTARYLAQGMLRWYMLGQWAAEGWHDDVLYPQHTELAFRDNLLLAPTVRNSRERNDRYNSQHRRILEDNNPHDRPVELAYKRSANRYILRGVPQALGHASSESTVLVRMICTTIHAFKIKGTGYLFLGLGVRGDGSRVVTLSEAMCSFLQVPWYGIHLCNATQLPDERYLHAISAQFITENVLHTTRPTGTIVAICADSLWMSWLQTEAKRRGHQIIFITSQSTYDPQQTTFLHHDNLDLIIRQKIPAATSLVVNLSTHEDDQDLFKRVCSVLPHGRAKMRDSSAFFRTNSTDCESMRAPANCQSFAEKCVKEVDDISASSYQEPKTWKMSPKDATQHPVHPASMILNWTEPHSLPVTILPATKDVAFSPEKTYLVVGSSDIARSICEWMMEAGARYFTITSRTPLHLTGWAKDMATKGAIIDVGAMDVTDARSVRELITSTRSGRNTHGIAMPPIGGVIHLGLLLRDAAFSNMSFKDLQTVTDIKATGSLNLHEQLKDENLEFFVLVSSISYSVGNSGQSNYAAGNAFMVGLAKYRRRMGLSASVVHLGRVTGIGYIHRNAQQKPLALTSEELRNKGVYPISERDLHQIFAEAILASPADSGTEPELITGIRDIEPDMVKTCAFANVPMFAHLLTQPSTTAHLRAQPILTVRQRLNQEVSEPSSSSSNNIDSIVKTALVEKLGALLQMDAIDEEKSLLDLGIDSLVAAEIGSWARKELRVQIPNSLIFGGASVKDIVAVAVTHLDRGWVRLNNGQVEGGEKK